MFEARPTHWLATTYAFVTEGGLHGRLELGLLVDRGRLELGIENGTDRHEYRLLGPGLFRAAHEMRNGDTLIATAESGSRFGTWSEIRWCGQSYRLERDGLLASTFRLLEGTDCCGELRRLSWWRGGIVVDLPPDLSIELRCFVLALAIWRWRAMIPTASP